MRQAVLLMYAVCFVLGVVALVLSGEFTTSSARVSGHVGEHKLHVMTVFGTRPDTIKMAPVVACACPRIGDRIRVGVRDRATSQDARRSAGAFSISRPDFDLDIMTQRSDADRITTRVLTAWSRCCRKRAPTWCWCTATPRRLRLPPRGVLSGHPGRSRRGRACVPNDPWMPFPEEMNRRLTGTIASYHFAPTPLLAKPTCFAEQRLLPQDAIIRHRQHGHRSRSSLTAARIDLSAPPRCRRARSRARPIVLVTAHRREHHPNMREMCEALACESAPTCRAPADCTGRSDPSPHRSHRSRTTRCSTACRACCWSNRSTMPHMVDAVRTLYVRADRFRRLARRSAEPRQSRSW